METIAKGAEAILYKNEDKVIKERVRKGYRIPVIDDDLRRKRTRLEARLMNEARRVGVPLARELGENKIEIDFIEGKMVKDTLDKGNAKEIGKKMGEGIAKLHSSGIIHGDLTTSNMILTQNNKLFFIDFGLGSRSERIEDMAVDLYVLREVITSTHNQIEKELWKSILDAYKKAMKMNARHAGVGSQNGSDKVIKTLHEIELRGRYRKKSKVE